MSKQNSKVPMPSKMSNYIDHIVQLLNDKYGYADKNRMPNGVYFIFNKYTYGQWMMRGGKKSECFEKATIYIEYAELTEAMESNILPTEIQKLL